MASNGVHSRFSVSMLFCIVNATCTYEYSIGLFLEIKSHSSFDLGHIRLTHFPPLEEIVKKILCVLKLTRVFYWSKLERSSFDKNQKF